MSAVRIATFLLAVTASFLGGVTAQESADARTAGQLARRVAIFEVHNGTLLDGLARLSAEDLQLSFAFEDILRPKFADPRAAPIRFNLVLHDRTVREILDSLCERDVRYMWRQYESTINVYPRSAEADKSYLMNRRLPQLELKSLKNAGEAVFAIVGQLPPPFEQIAWSQGGGDVSYELPWTGTLRNLTVRQAFDRVALSLGPNGGWVFNGSREFRTIGFHNRRLHGVGPVGGTN